MLNLPNEILIRILRNLFHITEDFRRYGNISDILSCRVVCKRLADVGALIAFRHVNLMHSEEGYQRLFALSCSGHKDKVLYLTYSFEDFEPERIPRDNFADYVNRNMGESIFRELPSNKQVNESHKEYCRRHLQNCFLGDTNLDVACLTVVLPRLGRLSSICISQSMHNLSSLEFEGMFAVQVFGHLLQLPTGPRVFRTITAALTAANVKLTNFVLRSYDLHGYDIPLTGILQSLSPVRSAFYKNIFGHLKTLSVALPPQDEPLNVEGLLTLIHSAPSLEKLEMSFCYGVDMMLSSELLDCLSIPKLRNVRIANGHFYTPTSLMNFLKAHSTTLERLELCNVVLMEGSWESVFSQIRNTLSLDSSDMEGDFCIDSDINSVEVSSAGTMHGLRNLPPHVIQSFIEKRSDVNPFDWLREKAGLVHKCQNYGEPCSEDIFPTFEYLPHSGNCYLPLYYSDDGRPICVWSA